MTTKYLIAKYAPDLRRMEPRNIGIILWSHGVTECKFLDESVSATFVNEVDTYKRWVTYWTEILTKKEIEKPRSREKVSRNNPDYLEAVQRTSNGNYLLFEGGQLTEPIAKSNIPDALEFLFKTLVLPPGVPLPKERKNP